MTHPKEKTIGGAITVSVDYSGYPRWTRIKDDRGNWVATLNEEEAHDLHYAMTRIVAFLEDARQVDRLRGIDA
jgi:hypothetical protein